MLDLTAVFDVDNHKLLMLQTEATKATVAPYNALVASRHCFVFLMGVCLTVVCGVPQSSCFGPLSFSLFTNDVQLRSETQSPDSAIVEFVIKIKYPFTSTSHCQLD